jgi:hypothetical protein
MVVPDALSRATMDRTVVLCHKCLECVGTVEEDLDVILTRDPVTVAEMRAAQEVAYGEDGTQLPKRDAVRNEDGLWCRVLGENDVRVFVPPVLRRKVIMESHGSATAGHWGVLRTAAKVRGDISGKDGTPMSKRR